MTETEMVDALIDFLKSLFSEALNWPDRTAPHEDTEHWIAIRNAAWEKLDDLRDSIVEVFSIYRHIGTSLSDHIANFLIHIEAIVMAELATMITLEGPDYGMILAELREEARGKFSAVHRALDEIIRVHHESRASA